MPSYPHPAAFSNSTAVRILNPTQRKSEPVPFFLTTRWVPRAVHKAPVQTRLKSAVLPRTTSGAPSKRQHKRPSKQPEFEVDGDFCESTPIQQLKVALFLMLSTLMSTEIVSQITDVSTAVQALCAVLSGYIFADFGTGVYHWAVDNYGSADTPIFGYQIAAFQGHHKAPWTITNRAFANNLHRLTDPTSPQMLLLLLADLPVVVEAFAASALLFIVLSQELHRQTHFTRASYFVQVLQRTGIIVSKKTHLQHHLSPFGEKYCIVSGICNGFLDDYKVFRRLEAMVYRFNGVEPISWKLDPKLKEEALLL